MPSFFTHLHSQTMFITRLGPLALKVNIDRSFRLFLIWTSDILGRYKMVDFLNHDEDRRKLYAWVELSCVVKLDYFDIVVTRQRILNDNQFNLLFFFFFLE